MILPTLVGAVLLGLFAIDLGWATYGVPLATTAHGISEVFSSGRGLRVMIDLAGLAIAGGLYIVPTFAAVQAWAGADRRARVIAGVNVLNAAAMVGGTVLIAILQTIGLTTPALFVLIGLGCLLVAIAIGRTMPPHAPAEFLSILIIAYYPDEV